MESVYVAKPNILVLDIETSPGVAYIWRMFKENISLDQLIEPSRVICAAWKWYGKREMFFAAEWFIGREAMLTQLHRAILEADAIITYNGDKFDLIRLNGEFIEQGLKPVPAPTSIDLYKTVKKLGLISNKLDWATTFFKIGKKIDTGGFKLWRKVLDGDAVSQRKMARYNKHDVRLTAALYKKLRPYIRNHPFLHMEKKNPSCPNCGSTHMQSRGSRRTRTMKIERFECQSCGAWPDGKRTKIK
jgi:DNA polymerase elongation subunit (family B)